MEIDGSRATLSAEFKNLQRSITPPLEVSYDHLLITPPSHFRLRKVRGWLGGFCERGIVCSSNDSRAANSVKRILEAGFWPPIGAIFEPKNVMETTTHWGGLPHLKVTTSCHVLQSRNQPDCSRDRNIINTF